MELRHYQKAILNKLKHLGSIALFMGTGSGKTITSLTKATTLPIKKMLVVCPHSVVEQWQDVIEKDFSSNFQVFPINKKWTSTKKRDVLLRDFESSTSNTIIINFEIIHKVGLEQLIAEDWLIIIDESHRIKNVGTKRSPVITTKTALKLGELTPYKIILTATPTQGNFGGYIDYYSQLKFLGYINYPITTFNNRYCIFKDIYLPGRAYPIKQIVGYRHKEELDKTLQICSARYVPKFGDFDPQHIKIDLERPKNYAKVERDRVYQEIVLNNLARKRIGIKTLCTGEIMGFDHYSERIRYKDNTIKLDWLKDFLMDTDEVVAIYYHYNVELENLKKLCEKLGKTYIVINSETSNKYKEIQKDYDVMLGQFQAASESLDGLQHKCHIEVFFAMPESSLLYRQALGRIYRDGMKPEFVPMYYYLVTKNTIESEIYTLIEQKIEYNEETLNKLIVKCDI